MTIEVAPTVACNLKCSYCYQDPMRMAGNFGLGFVDLKKVIPVIKKANEGSVKHPHFTVFGGEPLLLGKLTLERLWGFGLQEYGCNGVQTNGELIDEEWIRLFQKYNVGIGLSVDGPWPLNSARSNEEGTRKSLESLDKLCQLGLHPGIHVILSKCNGAERLSTLVDWIKEIDEKGVSEVRIHLLEVDTAAGQAVALSEDDTIASFLELSKVETRCIYQPFQDMKKLTLGLLDAENSWGIGCVWMGCDPYTTPAVQKVNGDGTLSNCGRVNKDGVDYLKASSPGRERTIALFNTPYEFGGCKGCRFFFACKGQCPGEAMGGDWRNRSSHCKSYLEVFEHYESEFRESARLPSLVEETRKELEGLVLGQRDHGDAHADTPHRDTPHVDNYRMIVPVYGKT